MLPLGPDGTPATYPAPDVEVLSVSRGQAILLSGGFALVLAVGCTSTVPSPSSSATLSASGEAVVGSWPPGCKDIELRAPDGSPVELSGTWTDVSREDAFQMTWYILTQGDCFYGTGTVADVREEGPFMTSISVMMYTGTIQPDLRIDGEMLHVGPRPPSMRTVPSYAPVRLLIKFDANGGVEIHEDRVAGEIDPPRCPDPLFCLPPMLLRPGGG
jgi:hypothetical protein